MGHALSAWGLATPRGEPAYVFQGRLGGKTIRVTIGTPAARSIDEAGTKGASCNGKSTMATTLPSLRREEGRQGC